MANESPNPVDPVAPQWSHAALVTIDMQNDFALPGGSGFVPGTDKILPTFARLVDTFRNRRRPIFHAIRLYREDGSNAERCRQALLKSGKSLARPGTAGARAIEAIRSGAAANLDRELLAGDFVELGEAEWLFYKPRWSAFYRTGLEERLRSLEVATVVIAGCNFPNCPSATLFDATERDFRVVLVTDAVSGLTESGQRWCEGIGVTLWTADQVGGQ